MSAEEGVPPADQAAEEAASKVNGLQEKGFAAILEIMAAVIEGGASITEAQFMSIMRSPAAALVKKGTSKMVKEAGKADEEGDGPCKVTPFVTALGESVNRLMDEQYAIASNSFTKRVFKAMDKDGGGTIGQSELDEVIQVMQSLGSDPALAGATLGLFTRFLDEDGNGVLEADDVVRLQIAFIQMVMSQVSRFMGIAVDAFTADSVSAPFGACIAEAMANEENPLASKLPVAIDELVTKLITTEEGGEAIADGLIAELMQLMEGEVPQFALGQFLAPVLASGEATFSVVDFIDAFNQQMSPIMDMVVGMAEDMIGAMVPQMVGELAGGLPVPLFDAELLGTGAAKFATDLIKTLPKIVKLEMTGPLEAIFDLIDIDGSGEVDAEEIKKFLNVMNPKEEGSEGDKKKYLSDLLGIIDVSNTGSLSEQDIVQFLHKFVRIGQAFANAGLHTVSRVASVPNFKKLTAVFASAVLELPEEAMEQLSPMGIKQPKEYLTTGIKICELEAVLNNVLGAMGADGRKENAFEGNKIRICMIGDGGVGKTALLQRFMTPTMAWDDSYNPTIFDDSEGPDGAVQAGGRTFGVILRDTAGQETYAMINSVSFQGQDVFLCCFNLSDDGTSLRNLEAKWKGDLAPFTTGNVKIVLVGCKADIKSASNTQEEIDRVKAALNACDYVETTATKADESGGVTGLNGVINRAAMAVVLS